MKKTDTIEKIAHSKGKHSLVYLFTIVMAISSCSVSKKINKQANLLLLQDAVIGTGHIGISIFEPATNTYWYNYNANKYFVPASNTKLFSLYAGLKYLGDSLVAAKYLEQNNSLYIKPSGDPSFLHPDFAKQPLFNLLQTKGTSIFVEATNTVTPLGAGWAWDDYDQDYVAERSAFPIFGNLLWISTKPITPKGILSYAFTDSVLQPNKQLLYAKPGYFADKIRYTPKPDYLRKKHENIFLIDSVAKEATVPFITSNGNTAVAILSSLLHKKIDTGSAAGKDYRLLYSQPADSLFKPMMHNSDNFFAEQTLLMASNEHLGFMNEKAIIDSILQYDLKDIPQRPNWVDGSGLSRYNLFTPQSFIYLLNKMKNEFGLQRLQGILPTGGTGTLKNYYSTDSTFIYAKTGTLGGTVALSGFLITQKNKLLIFSVLTNNFKGRASAVRRAVEKFIKQIRRQY
jgi:D-alanyl-D-alanine carboxypeptidase/D-alanyl-D-alanine-endopeptidase (penicillin-binding protein 4)